MRTSSFYLLTSLAILLIAFGCKTEKQDLEVETVADYLPLQTGKYITYRLDSLVFTNSGRAEETHSYQEKHAVDAQIMDNLGRPAYRVFRHIRDTAAAQPWRPSGSYFITALANSAEVIEDNLRVIKLVSPVKEGATWKGNRFLGDNPYGLKYSFSNDDNMEDWEFKMENVNEMLVLKGVPISNVVTVSSINENLNAPVTDAGSYGARTTSIEKFAKGIGAVYQEFYMWEYQPNPGSSGYKIGFGVKRSMIDHN
ncbi:MAG TPA: hypothetical protein VEY06_01990 [Flavisolibacter sp.]|nr:hypothetical protein [Flavisolibacter sp.]